jgi:hypothetical protein
MMDFLRRALVLGLFTVFTVPLHAGQGVASKPKVDLTPAQMEVFLLNAKVIAKKNLAVGVTDSQRFTLSDGQVTHDAHVQDVDIAMPVFNAGGKTELNFKDSYRFNIAGYKLAQLVGLDNVPMSVERRLDGKSAAVTWWVDDVMMDEKERVKQTGEKRSGPDPERTAKQTHVMRVWDELIQNKDRNQGNLLWTTDWKLWLIDHTRAFRIGRELLKPDELTRCEASLLKHLRGLTAEAVAMAVGRSLTRDEAAAVAARAALIVKHFDEQIARRGEPAVLFTLAQ